MGAGRLSRSHRRAKHIREYSGADRIRRGASDRLEVGPGGLFERTEGSQVLRVGGALSERVGGTHVTRAKRVESTVRGRTRIDGRADTILLGGAMSEVHAGAEVVLAGMSDDLVLGLGSRVTAPFDLWLTGLLGLEEKLATCAFDGAVVDIASTLFEREYGTGVHNAGSAVFSGAVYATQATGFRRLMKVSSGVRNLSSGGGGGGSSSSSGASSAAASPAAAPEPGLLGTVDAPRPNAFDSEPANLARLADQAAAAEDTAHYERVEDVSETAADLQDLAHRQAADESPEEAARAASRIPSPVDDPTGGSGLATVDDAAPSEAGPGLSSATPGDPPRVEPDWAPTSHPEPTYGRGQVPIGETFEEFRYEAVVGARPDKLLSDDAQASADVAAFRIVHDAQDDVRDMAREAVRQSGPLADSTNVLDMNAVEAHEYLVAARNGAAEAGDTGEATRIQNLIDALDRYAFDRYTTGLADAEAQHDATPRRLPPHVDAGALERRLSALAQDEFARMDDPGLSDAERHELSKRASTLMLAAQDAQAGLDPMAYVQAVLNSELNQVDSHIYADVARLISNAMEEGASASTRLSVGQAFWARAREAASTLLTRVGLDSWFGAGGASGIDELSEANHPVRFLESSADLRLSDPGLPPDPTARNLDFDAAPVTGEADLSPVGSGSAAPVPSSRAPDPQIEAASRLNPTLDGDGAHWAAPTDLPEGSERTPWADERDRVPVATASGPAGPV